jgi:hypothetical protein
VSGESVGELRRLIRQSAVFDPVLKRAWIGVLPRMSAVHRAELEAILKLEHGVDPLPIGEGIGARPPAL